MSPLNIHPEEAVNVPKKKKNKTLKVMLGIAALVAVPVVGTTLAASIGINVNGGSNTPIQFGQGVVQATACDSEVTVTAASAFTNASSAGSFGLSTVTISGINTDDCADKTFTVRVYRDSNATPLAVAAPTPSATSTITTTALKVVFKANGSHVLSEAEANYTLGGTTTSIVITLVTKPSATDVYKFTVESS
jgi:hypothetical protein